MITNKELVAYAKKALNHPYWYGCFGQISNKNLYYNKRKQYPNQYQWNCPDSQLNTRVFDCVGLIKGALWSNADFDKNPKYKSSQDVSANGMYDVCTRRGNIDDMPDVAGVLVFCDGHVGVYIGSGYVIEARGHAYGVQKTKLKERQFVRYGFCPWVEYLADEQKPKPKPSAKYFPKCSAKYHSIVDALNSLGINSKFAYRKKIAVANDIKNYHGGAQQNIDMLNMLKEGNLKRP